MDKKEKKIIVTHNGSFHADDVFAVATLEMMLGEDFNVEVIRSRDPEDFKKGDYVVDVGWVYDPSRQLFDHHQEGRAGKRDNGIFYSSFGLVWKEYGEIVCGSKEASDIVDKKLVVPIDAHDNGQTIIEEKYEDISPYTIEMFFMEMRPSFKEENQDYYEAFLRSVEIAKMMLERIILQARGFVEGSERIREQVRSQEGQDIVEIDHNLPWHEVIRTDFPEVKFVIFQHDNGNWQVKTINDSLTGYENRALLPESWRGKTNEELAETSGISDATFCHPNGFTGGAKSREGVLKMAEIALGR